MIVTTPYQHTNSNSRWVFGLSGFVASVPKPQSDRFYTTRVLDDTGNEVSVSITQQGSNIVVESLVLLDNHQLLVKE